MQVVLGHLKFADFAGTETYTLTVAQQLQKLGHDAVVYTHETGAMADFATQQGVRVVDSPFKLPPSCDAVLAQDAAIGYELAGRYPSAVRTCTLHSAHNPVQTPPQLPDVCHAVIVLNDRLARQAASLAHCPQVVRLRQPIDLKRFNLGGPVGQPRRKPRVLVLSNYEQARIGMVEEACRTAEMEFNLVGAFGRPAPSPEHAIADADIVISAGRGALEGMAAGRAVYVFSPGGADGWVTPSTYESMESDGFSGRATAAAIDGARLVADLRDWKPGLGEPNRDLVWANHDAERHALDLVELVHRLDAPPPPKIELLDEFARLVRLEWYGAARAEGAMNENRWLRAEAEALRKAALDAQISLREGVDRANREVERAHQNLDALIQTRRYQMARWIARPFDLLRARRRG